MIKPCQECNCHTNEKSEYLIENENVTHKARLCNTCHSEFSTFQTIKILEIKN